MDQLTSLRELLRNVDAVAAATLKQAMAGDVNAMLTVGLAVGTIVLLLQLFRPPKVSTNDKTVVITGCDTGLGRMLAVQAAGMGFNVFAGCLSTKSITELKQVPNIRPILWDVTKDSSSEEAAKTVAKHTKHVWALVNNAGIGKGSPADWQPMSDIRLTMDVNYYGVVCATKAFMGLLCEKDPVERRRGRVINISSVAGIIGAPGLSAYCASKFAVEGWTDAVRREMAPFGLDFVLIEPSFLNTPIIHGTDGAVWSAWEACSADAKQRWGEEYAKIKIKKMAKGVAKQAESPQLAVDVMLTALTAERPALRYKAGKMAKFVFHPVSLLPGWLQDILVGLLARREPVPAACK